eukprot:2705737-Alexandrium_andersonii.AAC.1
MPRARTPPPSHWAAPRVARSTTVAPSACCLSRCRMRNFILCCEGLPRIFCGTRALEVRPAASRSAAGRPLPHATGAG